MPSRQNILEKTFKRKQKEAKSKSEIKVGVLPQHLTMKQIRICLCDQTMIHIFYQGPPGTKIVDPAGLVAILPLLYGPNFSAEVFNGYLKNVRTAFYLRYVYVNGKRTRCLNKYAVHSKGCCNPAHENREGKSGKIVENLFEHKLDEADWEDFNDPQNQMIQRHEQAREANLIDPHKVAKQNKEEMENAITPRQAAPARSRILKTWDIFIQSDMQKKQLNKTKADEEKQIKAKTDKILREQENKNKGNKNKKQDPRASANLLKDARQRATLSVINQNSIQPKTAKDEQSEDRLRRLSLKRRNGGKAMPKGNTTKISREDAAMLKEGKKDKKLWRDQES